MISTVWKITSSSIGITLCCSVIFINRNNFCDLLFASLDIKALPKFGLKRKNLLLIIFDCTVHKNTAIFCQKKCEELLQQKKKEKKKLKKI